MAIILILLIFYSNVVLINCKTIKECKYNYYYEPVCGNDNETYANIEAFNCNRYLNHNYDLRIIYNGECQNKSPCFRGGFSEAGYNPVCASNGFTYDNVEQVRCLRRVNQGLTILHDGGCTINEVKHFLGLSIRSSACIVARNLYEWNPICGDNNITYSNPYEFLCYRPFSNALHKGECNSEIFKQCSKAFTSYYTLNNSICASDGNSYYSINHFICATILNKYLYIRHNKGPCKEEDNPCYFGPEFITGRGNPVCGTDGATYVNIEALWCIQYRYDKSLQYLHDGKCL